MSERKRKRKAAEELNGHSSKKKVSAPASSILEAGHRGNPNVVKPVIATSPGISFPKHLEFRAFTKPDEHGSELLLQSSDHPTIDYTATEDGRHAVNHLKHYVATYDPATNELDITEAKQMTVRRTIRQASPAEEYEAPAEPTSNYLAKRALTYSFGTKKSKKLVQSRVENVLYNRDAAPNTTNPLSEALLSSMPQSSAPGQTPDGKVVGTAAAIQAAKPLPEPDLTAVNVSEAYPLSNLVFPSPATATLTSMPISDWCNEISQGRTISTTSRFVAHRVDYICRSINANADKMDTQTPTKLHLLRYILLLLELFRKLSKAGTKTSLAPLAKWPSTDLSDRESLSTPLLASIVKKYSGSDHQPSRHLLTLLQTTILALTLHIPPPSGSHGYGILATDPTDIQADLMLERKDATKLLRELGCKMERPTDAEWALWGLKRPEQRQQTAVRFAKLRLPLVFPSAEAGMQKRTKKQRK